MKKIIQYLQHPILKILASPLAYVLYGLIIGMTQTDNIKWYDAILLIIIALSSQLISHFFQVKYSRANGPQLSNRILLICEAIFLISTILLIIQQHWIIAVLLIFYALAIHVVYFPYNISDSVYDLILAVFYKAVVLNTIAYFTQVSTVTSDFLLTLLPIVIVAIGIEFEISSLNNQLALKPKKPFFKNTSVMSFIIIAIGIILGVIQSFPSNSYFIVQIIFVVIMGIVIMPLLVKTNAQRQIQNKINYFSAVSLIFVLLYSLSILW